jgi:RNA polymerase sigma-54 factor
MSQQMRLAPRMIQSMEILQMPLAELQERIEQELENNPTLELAEPGDAEASEGSVAGDAQDASLARDSDEGGGLAIDERAGAEEFQRLESFEASNPDAIENEYGLSDRASAYDEVGDADGAGFERANRSIEEFERHGAAAPSGGERDAKMDAMASAPARGATLHEQLIGQWSLVDVEQALRAPGERIIQSLDDDGYLRTPLDRVAADDGHASLATYERALHAVQLFLEPAGVAARTAGECLLLQLDALADDGERLDWPREAFDHARTLVRDHLEDLMQNRLPRVAERSGLTLDQIRDGLMLLKRLSLAPARRLAPDDNAPITPDAVIEYDADHDRYVAYLNESRIPLLRINQEYARLTRGRDLDKRGREFIRTNVTNAQWLIDAIGQRKRTLLRVVQAVATAQRDYFDYGPQNLRPLPMTQVADELGIHVATVSRAVSDKHVRTPRGVVPLRRFFSGGVQTKGEAGDAGEEMAWDAIKDALREVIAHEDKKLPMSDESLVEELKKRGIEIARRTIAKYRDQLGIPTARMRRQY